MLTGLISATSGDAIIAGASVLAQMQEIRHSLGKLVELLNVLLSV
jgi:ABC-type multidrug transport system ATPase subunit